MFKSNKFRYVFAGLLTATLTSFAASCSDDNNGDDSKKEVTPAEMKFIITADDVSKDLKGGAYMQVFSDLSNATRRDISIYGEASATMSPDGFTQVTFNPSTQIFTGHIYAKGASTEGGIGQTGKRTNGLRTFSFNGSALTLVKPLVVDNFGNTGIYGPYAYAAENGNPAVVRVASNGDGTKISLDFSKYQINGANPSITGITDLGNNQVAIALNYADRDSFAVAFADYNLNVQSVTFSQRAGHSLSGRKATRYNQLVKDDQGNLYAFGGTATSNNKAGVALIKKGEHEFDNSYYFDLNAATGGYRVRKVFHITGNKFLLELFAEQGKSENMGATGRFVIADVVAKTITNVTGLPSDYSGSYVGWGDNYDGKFYLPLSAGTGLLRTQDKNITPTVYAIDANTGRATVFMTLKQSNIIKGFTIAKK